MAAAEGTGRRRAARERGDILDRNGEPLADSVDGLMVVGRPGADRATDAPRSRAFLSKRLDVDYVDTLARLRERGQPVRVHRPPGALDAGHRRARRGRGARATRALDPARPGARLPGRRRGGQPGRLHGHRRSRSALAGLEHTFDGTSPAPTATARYEVGGGNRIPLGENTVTRRGRRRGPHTTIDLDLQWYTQRVLRQTVERHGADSGLRGRHGHAAPASCSRSPTTRRSTPATRRLDRQRRPAVRGAQRRLRARLGREGAHPQLAHRRRARSPPRPEIVVPGGAGAPGPADPRLVRPRHDPAHPGRRRSPSRPTSAPCWRPTSSSPGQLRAYLAEFGLGQRTDIGVRGETPGLLPDRRPVDQPDRGPDRVRPVALGQRRADGRRGQHDRQRRRPGLARA